MLGKCTWFEIPISNEKAAIDFYGKVFGWHLKKIEETIEKERRDLWHIYTEEEYPIGALYLDKNKSGQDGIEIFVVVHDIEEAEQTAEILHGKKVIGKTAVPAGSGFYGKLRDPDGNLIGIWSS